MSKRLLFTLVIVVLSCTVTKRVHLPGYHIEWKKNYNNDHGQTEKGPAYSSHNLNQTEKSQQSEFNLNSATNSLIDSNKPSVDSKDLTIQSKFQLFNEKQGTRPFFKKFFTLAQVAPHNTVKNKAPKTITIRPFYIQVEPETLHIIGLVVLIFGSMLVLTSLFMTYNLLNFFNGSAWSNIGNSGSVGGCFTAIVFILLMFLIFYIFYLLVQYVLGGPFLGFIFGFSFMFIGITMMLISKWLTSRR